MSKRLEKEYSKENCGTSSLAKIAGYYEQQFAIDSPIFSYVTAFNLNTVRLSDLNQIFSVFATQVATIAILWLSGPNINVFNYFLLDIVDSSLLSGIGDRTPTKVIRATPQNNACNTEDACYCGTIGWLENLNLTVPEGRESAATR